MSEIAILKYMIALFCGAGTLAIGWSLAVQKTMTRLALFFALSMTAIVVLGVDAYGIEPYWIETTHLKIHDAELAPALKGLRIVQITDIHMEHGIGFRELEMIRKVNALKPDLVFFNGDVINGLSQVEPARKLFRSLKARIGVFGVPGDTDRIYLDSYKFQQAMAPSGLNVLVNESRVLDIPGGRSLWIAGIDDPEPANLQKALRNVPQGSPVLLLSASPDILDHLGGRKMNLILAGDTHGGQVGIDFLIRLSDYANRTPYMRGLFKKNQSQLYVNRGIGTSTRPLRFLCRPEITLIEVAP